MAECKQFSVNLELKIGNRNQDIIITGNFNGKCPDWGSVEETKYLG